MVDANPSSSTGASGGPVIDQDQLCSVCQRLTLAALGREGILIDHVSQHAAECWLCLVLWRTCKDNLPGWPDEYSAISLENLRGDGSSPYSFLTATCPAANNLYTIGLGYLFTSQGKMTLCVCSSLMYEGIGAYDPVVLGSPLGQTNTASVSSFQFAQSELDNCIKEHRCGFLSTVESPGTNTKVLPSRLIVLDQHPRLVDLVKPEWEYAALSYSWGLEKMSQVVDDHPGEERSIEKSRKKLLDTYYLTTWESLPAKRQKLEIDKLPKTLRDAIIITQKLGVQYLWVDSVCIVQDRVQDWQSEAPKMGQIYNNAKFTIAVDRGDNMNSGCFNSADHIEAFSVDGPILRFSETIAKLSEQSVYFKPFTTQEKHLIYDPASPNRYRLDQRRQMTNRSLINDLLQSKLERRAWCLQERLLSPRILHFASTGLFWECNQTFICEDPSKQKKVRNANHHMSIRRLNWTSRDQTVLVMQWCQNVLEDYCGRHISFTSDRLPAISSVAKLYNSRIYGEYMAGIFSQDIHIGLAWAARTMGRKWTPDEKEFPSWSWITRAETNIQWHRFQNRGHVTVCEFIRANTSLHSTDPYGRIKSAILTLEGRMMDYYVEYRPPESTSPKWGVGNIPATGIVTMKDMKLETVKIGTVWHDEMPDTKTYATKFFELYSELDTSGMMQAVGLLLVEVTASEVTASKKRQLRRIGIAKIALDRRDVSRSSLYQIELI
jgi:hypothetical protein